MNNIATTLNNAMKRAAKSVINNVAQDGVIVLKKTLDKHGFGRSEYLKNYEVYSHVIRDSVLFEIVLDFEAVEPEDEVTKKALEKQTENLEQVEKTYGVKFNRAYTTVRDARTPARDARTGARDARTPARDARIGAQQRLVAHEIALRAPRSARISRKGKLSVTLKRSMRETEKQVHLPQGQFEGIMKDIMSDLSKVLLDNFVPELQKIINNYVV